LIGLHNTLDFAPLLKGRNYADLFLVEIPSEALQSNPIINMDHKPKITKVDNLSFECPNRQANFDAGAGIYIDGGDLIVYSTFHYRGKRAQIKFNEYLPPYKGLSGTLTKDNSWIEMFEETHFQGRRLAIRGTANMNLENFDEVKAQNKGFEDAAHSIRFQLPKSSKCLLYEHKKFKKKLPLELNGTDNVVEHPVLSDKDAGKVSSIKYIP